MRFDRPDQALNADLYWAVCSADLMQLPQSLTHKALQSISDAAHLHALQEWITGKDHSQPLKALISERQPSRLGIYYETLWQYVLEHYPGFQLICRNLAVREEGKTLGELDFIYYCKHRERYVHLETAVKYYLGLESPRLPSATPQPALSWSQWLGPGTRDRLDLKLLKMLNHQTRLTQNSICQNNLKQLGINDPLKEICLKGYLFYPLSFTCPEPQFSHPLHAHGHWLPIEQLGLLEAQTTNSDNWQIMRKEQWLAPQTHHDPELLSLEKLEHQLTQQLNDRPFPVMVANMQPTSTGYRENARFFITPSQWPLS